MKIEPNLLIEASAGTGKTQALAERLISLLAQEVKPQEIVALTFSRAAAGEIFERFVTLLASRAPGDAKTAQRLREVIATQHLSQIGTLDSFLMRIVRSFPLELGLCGELEMMDDYRAAVERAKTSFTILRRTDATTRRAFSEAFSLAMNREDVRSFVNSYRTFIQDWHEQVLAHPQAAAWGEPTTIWSEDPPRLDVWSRELAEVADRLVACAGSEKLLLDFAEWVRNFKGGFSNLKGLADKLLAKDDLFAGATIELKYNKKEYSFGGETVRAIREALQAVFGYALRQKLELAKGIYSLISAYELEYAGKVRGKGKLVFGDVPRLIGALREDLRLALEYRLDTRIRAWALDEFQDTSREQWSALAPLIDEAKQSDGEKSVFIVGDRKQAIYGWRNGDVRIFTGERTSGVYELDELAKTYRSGAPIVEAVNRIFVDGPLRQHFPTWESPVHQTARPELGGFVQRVEASGSKQEDFVDPVFRALQAVDPIARHLSAAVLVRSNTFGELLATELKSRGLKGVVWEGESAIADTPALVPFLDLVALADHPGDKLAYNHFVTTPLAKVRFPEGVPPATEVSAWAAQAFTSRGLVRVFRELRALLPEDPTAAWSVFTEERFTDFLRAAMEFELEPNPGRRLSDFARFLQAKEKRNLAEPGKIKIMTIHRSKGLGFDYVVLPLYEHGSLTAEASGPLLGRNWILPDPGSAVTRQVAGLAEAWEERQLREEQEALCVYYVALTRAKRAMTLVLHPEPKKATEAVRFSDLVRESIPEEIGDPAWYSKLEPVKEEGLDQQEDPPDYQRAPRCRVERRLPSLNFHSGIPAGRLFRLDSPRQSAAARGTAAHAAYERIEWIDPETLKSELEREIIASDDGWRRAFIRPTGKATLWREQSFELALGGRWISGQFDRIVFEGEGDDRCATIYDFKTNARHREESDEAFAARLRATYGAQMAAYRNALAVLTGLTSERIATVLLSTALQTAIGVGD